MPVCEGLPYGPCPAKKNDKSVVIGKGDLLLCPSCDTERRRLFDEELKSKDKHNSERSGSSSKSSSTSENAQSSRSGHTRKLQATASASMSSSDSLQQQQQQGTCAPNNAESDHSSGVKTIINELLTYVMFYRDRCTSTDLHTLIVRFYSPGEILTAKTTILNQFEAHLSGCQYATNRRHTTTRPAHEAEVEDILGLLELLDNKQVIGSIQFAAVSMERLPKYGPNEINVCTVVDRQLHIDKELVELKDALNFNNDAQLITVGDKMMDTVNKRLNAVTDTFNGQLRQLESLCQNFKTMTTAATELAANNRPSTITAAPTEDRSANIIAFGLTEDRNSSVWNAVLSKALQHVAGRPTEIVDAFRIGKFNAAQDRPRPVIVKLRNVWDRRIILSNARKLSDNVEFRRIGFAADEPLEIRRKNTIKRLHYKATRDGKQASLSDAGDSLLVDGVLVFSLRDGFIRNSSSASNVNTYPING